MSIFSLQGRTALITGAASGLGQAIAEGFSNQGAHVVVADIDESKAEQVVQNLKAAGGQASGIVLDVTDREAVTTVIDEVATTHQRLDIVVNCAGIVALDPVEEVKPSDWDAILEVNLTGAFAVSQAAASVMKAHGYGRLITIASQAGHVALENHVAYGSAKAALYGMTASLARELGPHGITANTISPTVVMTELGRKAWDGPHGDAHKAEIPTGRFAEPHEIAAAAIYLASTEAAMVNGADLRVDGGFTIV